MKTLFLDKRGEVPIVVLVIGVLAICALTIFSFYSSSDFVRGKFDSANVVSDAVVSMKRFEIYREVGVSDEELEILFGIEKDSEERDYLPVKNSRVSVKFYIPN